MSLSSNGRIAFNITQKEKAILDEIAAILGFGIVLHDKTMDCYRFRVSRLSEFYLIALLLNGNLVLPHRISQLNKWITVLQAHNFNISHNPEPFVPTLFDNWICGFTDAEGSFFGMLFNLKIKIKSNKFSIKLYLLIILHHMEVSLSKNLGSVKNPKSGDTLKLLLLNSNLQKG